AGKVRAGHGAEVVGLNCDRGPVTILPAIDRERKAVSGYTAAQPVPYRTSESMLTFESLKDSRGERVFPLGLEPFLHTRFEMADFARRAKALGVNYIGICCGGA